MEYEVSTKAVDRYKDIFQKYYLAPKIAGVLYICHKEELSKKLMAIDQEVKPCKHSKIYFATEECFFSETLPRFVASDKSTFVLGK